MLGETNPTRPSLIENLNASAFQEQRVENVAIIIFLQMLHNLDSLLFSRRMRNALGARKCVGTIQNTLRFFTMKK